MLSKILRKSAGVCWQFVYHTLHRRIHSFYLARFLQPVHHHDVSFDFSGRCLRIQNLRGDLAAISDVINSRLGVSLVSLQACSVGACYWHFPWRLTFDDIFIALSVGSFPASPFPALDPHTPVVRTTHAGAQPSSLTNAASPTPESVPLPPSQTPTSAALTETMGVISQMLQTVIEQSSLAATRLRVLVTLPTAESTILVFTLRSAELHTSQNAVSGGQWDVSACFDCAEASLQLTHAEVPHLAAEGDSVSSSNRSPSPSFTSRLSTPQYRAHPNASPCPKAASRPNMGDGDTTSGATYVFYCAQSDSGGVHFEFTWRDQEETALSASFPPATIHISRRLIGALRQTETAIRSESQKVGKASNATDAGSDFRSPATPRDGLDDSASPTADDGFRGWPWLRGMMLRFSGLGLTQGDGISNSNCSSARDHPSSPAPVEADYISMQSYFGLTPEEEEDEEQESGCHPSLLAVDRDEQQVLSKLLAATDEVKTYLLEELRKEEAEGEKDASRATSILIRPLVSLAKCLRRDSSLTERRDGLMQLGEDGVSVSVCLRAVSLLIDPNDSVETLRQDNLFLVHPLLSGRVLQASLLDISLKASKDLNVQVGDLSVQLMELRRPSNARVATCVSQRVLQTSQPPSLAPTANPECWVLDTHDARYVSEQVYAHLAYPGSSLSVAPFLTMQLEATQLGDSQIDPDLEFMVSLAPLTCYLTNELKSVMHNVIALFVRSPEVVATSGDQSLDSTYRSGQDEPQLVNLQQNISTSSPMMSTRLYAECIRLVGVSPTAPDNGSVLGLVTLENASFFHFNSSASLAVDCLLGIGSLRAQQLRLAPLVLTKDPLWFAFSPQVYFDEKSQVFQLTDLSHDERPTATSTLDSGSLPSIQVDWGITQWQETQSSQIPTAIGDVTQSSRRGANPSAPMSTIYPPSVASLYWKKPEPETMSTDPSNYQLRIHVVALIFSWPRAFLAEWFNSLRALADLNPTTVPPSAEDCVSGEESLECPVAEEFRTSPATLSHESWTSWLKSLADSLRITVCVDKTISHFIPPDPSTVAIAATLGQIRFEIPSSNSFTASLDCLEVTVFLFNQLLLQWVQHKPCVSSRQTTIPALQISVSVGEQNKLRLQLSGIDCELNESLLVLALLLYKETSPATNIGTCITASQETCDEDQAVLETTLAYEAQSFTWHQWLSFGSYSLSMSADHVSFSLASDVILQTLPATLDLLRTGDVANWPLSRPLLWGYELHIERLALNVDVGAMKITKIREAVLDASLCLRETGTISVATFAKGTEETDSTLELRRHGLFAIAGSSCDDKGDQLNPPQQVVSVCNLDLHFLESWFLAKGNRPETIKLDHVHVSLAASTIAALSKSCNQCFEVLNMPVDDRCCLRDVISRLLKRESMPSGSSMVFSQPTPVQPTFFTPAPLSSLTAMNDLHQESEDDLWEVDEYYNDLVAELGDHCVAEGWKESVIAARPAPGPVWSLNFQVEIKQFVCDFRTISVMDSCIASLRSEHLLWTVSTAKDDAAGIIPLKKINFSCQGYCVRDMTQQSHFEFVCQPYRTSETRALRGSSAISAEIAAYKWRSEFRPSISTNGDYLLIQSEPSSCGSLTPPVSHSGSSSGNSPQSLVEHSVSVALTPLWITLDMRTLTAFNDFVESLEALKNLHESLRSSRGSAGEEIPQDLLGCETYVNAVSTAALLAVRSGLWDAVLAVTPGGPCVSTAAALDVNSTPPAHNRPVGSEHLLPPSFSEEAAAPLLIRSFESQELLVRFDFFSEGLDPQRLRQGGLLAALNFLAQFCTIEGLEIPFKRIKLEGLMRPKELMVRIIASSVADFDRSQVLRYAMRGTPVLRSLWDISASLRTLMNDALSQPTRPSAAMELAALRQLRQVFDSSEWALDAETSSPSRNSPRAVEFTDALENFDYNERVEMLLQLTRRSFVWVEDQALLSLRALAGQASGSLPFALRLAEHSGDFLRCFLVESLKISERFMSTCSRRIAAIDTSVSQHLCLRSRMLRKRPTIAESPANGKLTNDSGSPRWSFVEKGAPGFYEPRTAREGLQDAVVHLRRGWEQAYYIAEQIEFNHAWGARGGDIMAENRAMLMSVVSLEALQAVGRVLPVLLLKPVVTLAEAITSALQGTRNQLDPRQRAERTRSLRAPRVSAEALLK